MKFKTIFAKMTVCSLMLTALFGCGQASQTADGAQDTQSAQTTELTVFAAASMTETLNQIAEDYKTVDPNVSLTFNFASSGDLLSQIREGADCDVFISAAPKQMNALGRSGRAAGRHAHRPAREQGRARCSGGQPEGHRVL